MTGVNTHRVSFCLFLTFYFSLSTGSENALACLQDPGAMTAAPSFKLRAGLFHAPRINAGYLAT